MAPSGGPCGWRSSTTTSCRRRRRRPARSPSPTGSPWWSSTAACRSCRTSTSSSTTPSARCRATGSTSTTWSTAATPRSRSSAGTSSRSWSSGSIAQGASAYLSKGLEGEALVDAIEKVHAGKRVVPPEAHDRPKPRVAGPGTEFGLTAREAEIIALITQGLSQPGDRRAQLPLHQLGQDLHPHRLPQDGRRRRSQAVLWGVKHGFEPDVMSHISALIGRPTGWVPAGVVIRRPDSAILSGLEVSSPWRWRRPRMRPRTPDGDSWRIDRSEPCPTPVVVRTAELALRQHARGRVRPLPPDRPGQRRGGLGKASDAIGSKQPPRAERERYDAVTGQLDEAAGLVSTAVSPSSTARPGRSEALADRLAPRRQDALPEAPVSSTHRSGILGACEEGLRRGARHPHRHRWVRRHRRPRHQRCQSAPGSDCHWPGPWSSGLWGSACTPRCPGGSPRSAGAPPSTWCASVSGPGWDCSTCGLDGGDTADLRGGDRRRGPLPPAGVLGRRPAAGALRRPPCLADPVAGPLLGHGERAWACSGWRSSSSPSALAAGPD